MRDVFEAVQHVQAEVAELHKAVECLPDHERRIRTLEAWRYAIPTAAVIAVGSVIIAVIENTH
jgi:hypothetical protein